MTCTVDACPVCEHDALLKFGATSERAEIIQALIAMGLSEVAATVAEITTSRVKGKS